MILIFFYNIIFLLLIVMGIKKFIIIIIANKIGVLHTVKIFLYFLSHMILSNIHQLISIINCSELSFVE